jgi:hypothetical protein
MRDIDPTTAERILRDKPATMIRRGDDGSLVMSRDKWRLAARTEIAMTFAAEPPAPDDVAPIVMVLAEVERLAWERLEKQRTRSQVRFFLRNGDVVTFSGFFEDPPDA